LVAGLVGIGGKILPPEAMAARRELRCQVSQKAAKITKVW
jgi:hypothetical protein